MYKEPYNSTINTKVKEEILKLSEKINKERKEGNADSHKIYRLEEQKMVQGLFTNELGNSFGRYRNPW